MKLFFRHPLKRKRAHKVVPELPACSGSRLRRTDETSSIADYYEWNAYLRSIRQLGTRATTSQRWQCWVQCPETRYPPQGDNDGMQEGKIVANAARIAD
jgi:hypothetical protein